MWGGGDTRSREATKYSVHEEQGKRGRLKGGTLFTRWIGRDMSLPNFRLEVAPKNK